MATSKEKAGTAEEPEKVVRYIGKSNLRIIHDHQFKALGIEHPTLTWHRDAPLNDVPMSQISLSSTDFARCITADQDFKVVEVERA